MTIGHVRADDKKGIRLIDVGITGLGRIGPKALFIAGSGTGHAQAGIRIDIICTPKALTEFIGYILGLGRELTR